MQRFFTAGKKAPLRGMTAVAALLTFALVTQSGSQAGTPPNQREPSPPKAQRPKTAAYPSLDDPFSSPIASSVSLLSSRDRSLATPRCRPWPPLPIMLRAL